MKHGRLIVILLMVWALAYGKGNCAKGEPAPTENDKPSQKTRLKGKAQASSNLVRIYPGSLRDIGGYSKVPEVFGIMTANLDSRAIPYLKDANIQAIRTIFNWIPQPGQAGYVRGALEWYDEFLQKDPYNFWQPLLNNRYVRTLLDDSYGDVAVTLCGNPALYDPKLERNLEGAKENVAGYIKALKSLIPDNAQSKLKYFQITNEPEYFAESFDGNQKLAVESYVRIFNAVYDYAREQHPDVELPGNCVGHNGGYHIKPHSMAPIWDVWVKHFIDLVENPDALRFFNTQQYGMPSLRHFAYVCMTQNYAEMTRGIRPRYLVTEISTSLKGTRAENYQNQYIYHANDIFLMLHHPDKFVTRHAYMAASGTRYSFFNVIEGEGFTPEAPYWFYKTFQNLRGKILYFESEKKEIRVFASSPQENKVVIGLFNPTRGTQTVNLDPGISEDQIIKIIRRKSYFNNSISNASYYEESVDIDFPSTIEMEPVSAYAFEIELNNTIKRSNTVKTREFYGSCVRAGMDDTIRSTIPIPYIPSKSGNARLSIAVNKKPASGSYRFELNGKEYTINWDDTPDKTANCWNTMVGYIEIPLEKGDIEKNNILVLSPLTENHLLFTSIVYHLYSFEK
jgi:hypothetical protein